MSSCTLWVEDHEQQVAFILKGFLGELFGYFFQANNLHNLHSHEYA